LFRQPHFAHTASAKHLFELEIPYHSAFRKSRKRSGVHSSAFRASDHASGIRWFHAQGRSTRFALKLDIIHDQTTPPPIEVDRDNAQISIRSCSFLALHAF
jgi:hypothetical protein